MTVYRGLLGWKVMSALCRYLHANLDITAVIFDGSSLFPLVLLLFHKAGYT